MSEEEKIDPSPTDHPQSTEKESVNSESIIVNEITNQTSDIENMEVQKHPHHVTHKKKWGEYLLEFFMLFLAVFLGFVAENQREHNVEHEREEKYIQSLSCELASDITKLQTIILLRSNRELMTD